MGGKASQLSWQYRLTAWLLRLVFAFPLPVKLMQWAALSSQNLLRHHPVVNAGGVPGWWLGDEASEITILYLHGGGYAFGSTGAYRDMLLHLARAANARVLGVDYRLAPEYPFPAAVEDALAVWRWLLAEGVDPAKTLVAGDSAGGGLVLALLVSLRDAGLPLPALGVCLSPWVDLSLSGASLDGNAGRDYVSRQLLAGCATMYLGDGNRRGPLASPLFADLHGLPPLYIQAGGVEVLLDDSRRLAERVQAAGGEVELDVWAGMIHVWQMAASVVPEGRAALEAIGAWVRARLDVRVG